MTKKAGALFLFALWVSLASTQMAIACACCADPGYREHVLLPLLPYEFTVLSELEPDRSGNLYMTACGEDCITGINWSFSTPETEFNVSGRRITIVLNPSSAARTVLEAQAPEEMIYRAIDPKPGDNSTTVWLETEFLIPLQLYGSGPGWTGGTDAISAELIFYGGGNVCPNFDMVDHWLLDVGGPEQSAKFRLFGKLVVTP